MPRSRRTAIDNGFEDGGQNWFESSGFDPDPFSNNGTNVSYTLQNPTDGQHFVYIRFQDDLDNWGEAMEASIVLDTSAPSVPASGGFSIDNGSLSKAGTLTNDLIGFCSKNTKAL